ncbi:KHG/KDPG aldolase-like isoform X2 [Juglans microcarpa x Juglans regia]|uniref:KHG/KDPG aldolase-like isoform X2 n=1 Tax=Juglans microcarpa x Juglans regia TaxID=2249226 RepID=UPI001B7DBFF8|nr:KHG/KDPG aldolase-like isoform X2 [Juglans microcarpa x Juglans regia]XP_040995371.1 KHG/KDPG aldolase-like isoform X2 [Juglans microcarpa x Juglans regia]
MAETSLGICARTSSASLSLLSSPPRSPLRVSCYCPQLSPSPIDKTLTQIQNSGVIACLRANSAEQALKAARAALSGGISVLEIVMSTPGVFEVLQQLVQENPNPALGVGTVLNVEDAKNAINSGAKFLMSPAMVKDIMVDVKCAEVLYIPGVMTPTEILSAYDTGAKIVKIQSENISPEEQQQLFYQMPYLIKRQSYKIISMKFINLQILQLCRALRL